MRWVRGTLLVCATAAIVGVSALIGCTQLQTHDSLADLLKDRQGANSTPPPAEPEPTAAPRELARVPAPPYAVEPPDVLTIEVTVKDPKTGATAPLPEQPVTGTFLVREDGTVGLGKWGSVRVSGLKLDEASDAVRKHLANAPLASVAERDLSVVVDVVARNSKRYYVITEAADKRQEVYAFPATWQETVVDAVSGVDGLASVAGKQSVRIVRKKTAGGPDEVLPVDWNAVTQNGVMTTNYQILPGDRIFVTSK
ncbi:polysaccharide biosynthesis/export family protein [Frigoriglobus tundricola]|uniref:Putative polysaccharide export protein n=1 Tax=Frigoriglobus tundricola TaxID=2774151 RepID=A0A6M5YTF8_9BACT|nr:polysaccharide biosynthesis/export family protein [Frigoriglobus tundricola]QJW96724.1 putative polysaccharide export protein [Frigoriglobus tundricola]